MIRLRQGVPLYVRQPRGNALQAWRRAAALVWARGESLRDAAPECRPGAFAAYFSALDAEADAAEALARNVNRAA